jgi:Na+/proline symporter
LLAALGSKDGREIAARDQYRREIQNFEVARKDGAALVEKSSGKRVNDTNYIFLTFVTRYLPAGLVGLVLAMILGATMSSISSEMNALATVSIIDLYKRHARGEESAGHYLTASRWATLGWGCYAVTSAQYVKRMGSLIEAVNLLGSFFYGGCWVSLCWPSSSRGLGGAGHSGACWLVRR